MLYNVCNDYYAQVTAQKPLAPTVSFNPQHALVFGISTHHFTDKKSGH